MEPQVLRRVALLLSCEHGGNRVPSAHAHRFADAEEALASHRGWDPGALELARRWAALAEAPLRFATVTRLLVDLNRSPHNPRVFSPWTRGLDRDQRRALLRRYHEPYRAEVDGLVRALSTGEVRAVPVAASPSPGQAGGSPEGSPTATVLHLGIHSFTPSLNGRPRRPDLSFLYDPARPLERALCGAWVRQLKGRHPDAAVGRNDPYRGAADGLTTWLRQRHDPSAYLGIEVEVNQRLLGPGGAFPSWVVSALHHGMAEALEALGWPHPVAGAY